jgi:hypothetical protein
MTSLFRGSGSLVTCATALVASSAHGILSPRSGGDRTGSAPNKFNALTAATTVTMQNRRITPQTGRIMRLAPPLGRPSSWRPDGWWGRLYGATGRTNVRAGVLKVRTGDVNLSIGGRPSPRPSEGSFRVLRNRRGLQPQGWVRREEDKARMGVKG